MKPKLIELAEILKQKPEIKERLEDNYKYRNCFDCTTLPQYSDVLEYLGRDYKMDFTGIYLEGIVFDQLHISPGPLSDQSDETLTQIISLCKDVGKNV